MRDSIVLAGLVLALGSGAAEAAFIVDTGYVETYDVDMANAYASAFIVDETVTITLMQSYLLTGGSDFLEGKIATLAIYSDGGDGPGIKLFSDQFETHAVDGWQGLNGIAWTLEPGTYWISLETMNPGDTAQFFLGIALGLAPLDKNAWLPGIEGWVPSSDGYAWRIATAVPIPGAFWLLGSAMAGMGLARSRRRID
jgi:hypothetical protein